MRSASSQLSSASCELLLANASRQLLNLSTRRIAAHVHPRCLRLLERMPWYERRGKQVVKLVEIGMRPSFKSYVEYISRELVGHTVVLTNQARRRLSFQMHAFIRALRISRLHAPELARDTAKMFLPCRCCSHLEYKSCVIVGIGRLPRCGLGRSLAAAASAHYVFPVALPPVFA